MAVLSAVTPIAAAFELAPNALVSMPACLQYALKPDMEALPPFRDFR